MIKYKDLTGMRFGRLTAIKRIADHIEPSGRKVAMWECACECGNTIAVPAKRLKGGITKSCGCLQKDHPNGTKHGFAHTTLYNIYKGMIKRCYYKSENGYKNYGGRGIAVCDEWKNDNEKFFAWAIDNGYRNGLTIDRIDNSKGYCPENCRWVDMKAQCNNRRSNHIITYNNKSQTLTQWAEEYGIPPKTLSARILSLKWNTEKALTTPIRKHEIKERA